MAQLLTPLLLARSWNVTSIIRDPSQISAVLSTRTTEPGKLNVLVRSLEHVGSVAAAQAVLAETQPDYVIWAAGAGGKGGPAKTNAIDRDAAKHFVTAATEAPYVKKLLLISALSSRRSRAPWWDDEDWAQAQKVNTQIMPVYHEAKLEADEHMTAMAETRRRRGDHGFQGIILRPGSLSGDPPTGKVTLGKTSTKGSVSRGDVADVAARLLERDDTKGWVDMLSGDEEVQEAVAKLAQRKVDSIEGEDVREIYSRIA